MSSLRRVTLGEITSNFDSRRVPIKTSERRQGPYPYYGASGIIDSVEDYIFDGEYLLIAEDGENLRSRSTPIAFLAAGQFWVNNHAHVVQGNTQADTRFLAHLLSITEVSGYLTGSTQPKLTRRAMDSIELNIPPLETQQAIAEVLGALDDKIAANTKLAVTADELATAILRDSVESDHMVPLSTIATITMGSSPTGDTLNEVGNGTVFYQGVRDFGVRFPATRVWTTAPARMAKLGDTLISVRAPVGRVNLANEDLCVGRGLASAQSSDGRPATLFHLLKSSSHVWEPFEAEGTVFGSINKKQLAEISLPKIQPEKSPHLETKLGSIEARISRALDENETLVSTRDALLPQLMSGKLRVKDAERLVSATV